MTKVRWIELTVRRSARGWCCVHESDDRFEPAVIGHNDEIGSAEVERCVRCAPGRPAEARVAIVRFNSALQGNPVVLKLTLRDIDHRIDGIVAFAMPMYVAIDAILTP